MQLVKCGMVRQRPARHWTTRSAALGSWQSDSDRYNHNRDFNTCSRLIHRMHIRLSKRRIRLLVQNFVATLVLTDPETVSRAEALQQSPRLWAILLYFSSSKTRSRGINDLPVS